MIYILHKNKMISCMVAFFMVVGLFVFSASVLPNQEVELVKVSSNSIQQNQMNEVNHYFLNNTYHHQ